MCIDLLIDIQALIELENYDRNVVGKEDVWRITVKMTFIYCRGFTFIWFGSRTEFIKYGNQEQHHRQICFIEKYQGYVICLSVLRYTSADSMDINELTCLPHETHLFSKWH